jgi:hypothetical protein
VFALPPHILGSWFVDGPARQVGSLSVLRAAFSKTQEGAAMTVLDEMYPVEIKMVGFLTQEEVKSTNMPRARFLELVEEGIQQLADADWPAEDIEALRSEITPVVQTMPRFPLGTWMHSVRGCGCVVGEYIVATSELERAEINKELQVGLTSVSALLRENPNAGILEAYGYLIDELIADEVGASDWTRRRVSNVEIIDDADLLQKS